MPVFAALPDVLAEVAPVQATVLSIAIESVAREHGLVVAAAALRRAADWIEDK